MPTEGRHYVASGKYRVSLTAHPGLEKILPQKGELCIFGPEIRRREQNETDATKNFILENGSFVLFIAFSLSLLVWLLALIFLFDYVDYGVYKPAYVGFGWLFALVANFIKEQKLTPQEIEELKRILEEHQGDWR